MIFERIQSSAESLTKAEQKLVRELLARPRDVALGTAGELARRVGTHEATASRLAKKLGFESYAGFRDALRHEFIVKTDPALRVKNTLAIAKGPSIIADLAGEEAAALAALPTYISAQALDEAAQTLSGARKIFIFARGNAQALGVLADRRLRRMGVDTVLLDGDARDLAERLAAMEGSDALLAFAFRRAPRHYGVLLEEARALGVRSVVVSDTLGPALVPAPDHLLFAPRSGTADAFQTLLVPMTIANALVLQMARTQEEQALARLERLGTLLATFEGR